MFGVISEIEYISIRGLATSNEITVVVYLHDAIEHCPEEIDDAAAFGIEQVAAVLEVQQRQAEEIP